MKYWIATDKKEIFHWGSFDEDNQSFTTTQPYVLWFDSEEEQQVELDNLGVEWRQEDPEEQEEPVLEDYLLQQPPMIGEE